MWLIRAALRRPITILVAVVAIALINFAGVLEAAQGLTPDRFPNVTAALCGAAGVASAAMLVVLLIPARRWLIARSLSLRLVEMAPSVAASVSGPQPDSL